MKNEHFTFHLQYKHSGMFANSKYEELSFPKKSENVRPHSSNPIEYATPLCDPIQRHIPISLLKGIPDSQKFLRFRVKEDVN